MIHINCSYKLIPLYGPFAIHSYGFFIALGIIISTYYMQRNKRFIQLNLHENFSSILCVSIIAGIIGGRVVEIYSHYSAYSTWYDWYALWEGGYSALGAIISTTLITFLYLLFYKIPIIPLFDVAAIYTPLFQSIARIGCLTAGCCHGIPTTHFLSIIYDNPETIALHGIPVHPTQLYSSLLLFGLFLLMYKVLQHRIQIPGLLFSIYLMGAGIERFCTDFLRADRLIIHNVALSLHQIIALILIICSILCFIGILITTKKTSLDQK